ncbi:MAG TPA: tetratricopeptide repeat protein [Bryobacteraceae bacterium]
MPHSIGTPCGAVDATSRQTCFSLTCFRLSLCAIFGAALAAGADNPPGHPKLELRGRVTGVGRLRMIRVTLYGVESAFAASTITDPGGEFHFRDLPPGNYSLAVLRRNLGEIRRTVVISASLADRKGAVHVIVPYSATEAAADKSAAVVSKQQLSVPKNAWNEFMAAQKRLEKRDAEGAKRRLERAVELAPGFAAAWNSLGVMAYQSGDSATAEHAFRQALAAEPAMFEAAVNLGGVLLSQGHLEEALRYNQQAVAARPRDALANAQTGITFFQLGDGDRAEPYLAAAERADPAHFSRPQLFLARIYQMRGDWRAARRELQLCIALHPDDPDVPRLRREIGELGAR